MRQARRGTDAGPIALASYPGDVLAARLLLIEPR
jgi:hypothetical protein